MQPGRDLRMMLIFSEYRDYATILKKIIEVIIMLIFNSSTFTKNMAESPNTFTQFIPVKSKRTM